MLSGLFMHAVADSFGNAQPVRVLADKAPPRHFTAVLDYSMQGFDMDASASPENHCKAKRLTQSTLYVDPGSHVMAEIFVQEVGSQGEEAGSAPVIYTVEVRRRMGAETELEDLQVQDGALVPDWNPTVRAYTVELDRKQEIVRFSFQQVDSGQVVTLESDMQQSDGPGGGLYGRRLDSGDGSGGIGQQQFERSVLITTLDVGYTRDVSLTVISADLASTSQYTFTVKRPVCPKEFPFFDGATLSCTDICNSGYYGSTSTGRCTLCGRQGCAVCPSGGESCTLCLGGFEADGDSGCRSLGGAGSSGGVGGFAQVEGVLDRGSRNAGEAGSPFLATVLVSGGLLAVGLCAAVRLCSTGGGGPSQTSDSVFGRWEGSDDEDGTGPLMGPGAYDDDDSGL